MEAETIIIYSDLEFTKLSLVLYTYFAKHSIEEDIAILYNQIKIITPPPQT